MTPVQVGRLWLTGRRVVAFCTWVVSVTPTTVERLRAEAARYEEEGLAAAERLDKEGARQAFRRAVFCSTMADQIEAEIAANLLEPKAPRGKRKTLPAANQASTVSGAVTFTTEHRLNMSKARAPANKLAALARKLKPPLTLAELAEKVGISKSTMTLAGKGERPMPTHAAEKIQALTGYPVSAWRRLS